MAPVWGSFSRKVLGLIKSYALLSFQRPGPVCPFIAAACRPPAAAIACARAAASWLAGAESESVLAWRHQCSPPPNPGAEANEEMKRREIDDAGASPTLPASLAKWPLLLVPALCRVLPIA